MRFKLIISFLVIGTLLTTGVTYADENKLIKEDIKHLLALTNSQELGIKVINRIITSLKSA